MTNREQVLMGMLLEMTDIDKSFFGVKILKKVNFNLQSGEVHAFLGANGAGKSTLIKILSGAYTLDSGVVKMGGQELDMAHHTPETAFANGIFTIYQNFHLIPHLSVAENISLTEFSTGRRRLVNWRWLHQRAEEVLSEVGLRVDPGLPVRKLTVSQQQMLEIAIALSQKAKVIIMDEPTAALSQSEAERLFNLIREIRKGDVGIIYISHRLEEIQHIADRVTVLRDGMNVGSLVVGDNLNLAQMVEMIAGREVKSGRRARVTRPEGEYARVENLVVPGFGAANSFAVRRGEILGLTGLVGAGKSEFARALFGADRSLGGTVFVEGQPVNVSSPGRSIEGGIGFLPEDRDTSGLCMSLSLKDNISLTSLAKTSSSLFSVAHERQLTGRFRKNLTIRSVNLDQQVRYLTGGNKQKVIFAKWLFAHCRFLILDEPT
ncbi:MAG: sugar ABC transporter ATP-binding protein, partial [Planctomycetota bacterium]|nr:sugar ABC transporter ATP-binding protein [Planctomycetota bacterium]